MNLIVARGEPFLRAPHITTAACGVINASTSDPDENVSQK